VNHSGWLNKHYQSDLVHIDKKRWKRIYEISINIRLNSSWNRADDYGVKNRLMGEIQYVLIE
jgi:hypothetical protein